jgi:carbon-monoxide dehydrogenase small subunit
MSQQLSVVVNDKKHDVAVDPRQTLVYMLRDDLGYTGTHVGCTTGNCGACTVVLDGKTVKSCSVFACDVDGSKILTIEGLSTSADDLHPIQKAFVDHQGLQCGFCTPGMVLSTLHFLETHPDPTEDEVRHGISGNLCRCTGYQFIVESILAAAKAAREAA